MLLANKSKVHSGDHTNIWALVSGELIRSIKPISKIADAEFVNSAAFTPDGN